MIYIYILDPNDVHIQDDDADELHQVIYVAYEDRGEGEQTTIDLTVKDGQQIRLVAPLNIDPLTFAAEYLKDLQSIPETDQNLVEYTGDRLEPCRVYQRQIRIVQIIPETDKILAEYTGDRLEPCRIYRRQIRTLQSIPETDKNLAEYTRDRLESCYTKDR